MYWNEGDGGRRFKQMGDLPIRTEGLTRVTFLIFLISVAVLEYILRRPPAEADGNPPSNPKRATEQMKAPPIVAGMPGLHHLGQALEQHGRGLTPEVPDREPGTKGTKSS